LVSAVAAAARRTVVVNSGTPVIMPWVDQVDAVLWAGLPGQEGGHAVAAALFGDIEPAGRLVTTFPAADGAAPANGDLPYTEGTFIGYRGHHAGQAPPPAFWFGHGLGYSTWRYSKVRLVPDGPAPTVSVTNVGSRSSREVVQVYFKPRAADQPARRLAGRHRRTRGVCHHRGPGRPPHVAPLEPGHQRVGPAARRRRTAGGTGPRGRPRRARNSHSADHPVAGAYPSRRSTGEPVPGQGAGVPVP